MECQKAKNLKNCSCSYPECSKKGICCQCLKHHREKGELPACFFSPEIERTYNRSIENFLNDWQDNYQI